MNILVFDVGKTHVKLHLLDDSDFTLAVVDTNNRPLTDGSYPEADVGGLWEWLVENLKSLQAQFGIHRISITTHGATAALIDPERGGDGLVLPILDYEFTGVEEISEGYKGVRPHFSETGSPSLPAGLNLGRQLYWLSQSFPEEFERCSRILLYPQYWVWRLTDRCLSEVTSLGCHTDLWAPWQGDYSSLVDSCGWREKFPRMASAWDIAGTVSKELCGTTGLPETCEVVVGVHDSNASYLRYKKSMPNDQFAIVSTGTWSIVMNGFAQPSALQEHCDMLANVDVNGVPVVCSRFMGEREYATICETLGGDPDANTTEGHISALNEGDVFCLPCWQEGTGPFGKNPAEIRGTLPGEIPPAALASLYCALMLDYQLDLVASADRIILGGAFLKNSLLCRLLAQLRVDQPLLASSDITGTVMGAAQLCHWSGEPEHLPLERIKPTALAQLYEYRRRWRKICETHPDN